MSESEDDELVLALGPVAQTFHSLGVPFYLGGSVASSYHGAVGRRWMLTRFASLQDKTGFETCALGGVNKPSCRLTDEKLATKITNLRNSLNILAALPS